MNDDTLCDSESSEGDETESIADLTRDMKQLSLIPTKSVTFDLPTDDSKDTPSNADNSTNNQNDDADARLVHTAWLRRTSENVYMSNRKSMSLRTYVHTAH